MTVEGLRGASDPAAHHEFVRDLDGLGHERIGFIAGPLSFDTGRRRDEGYRQTLGQLGIRTREDWIADGAYIESGGNAAALQILSADAGDRPTGLFAANLMSGLGALRAIRELGMSVPADISLVAMDEHIIAEHTNPPFTTIAMPHYRMGVVAVEMLLDAIEGVRPIRHVMINEQPTVVPRASTAPPPGLG